jgi:hypothetical protein
MVYVHEQNMPKMTLKNHNSQKIYHFKPLKKVVLNLEEMKTYHVSISI